MRVVAMTKKVMEKLIDSTRMPGFRQIDISRILEALMIKVECLTVPQPRKRRTSNQGGGGAANNVAPSFLTTFATVHDFPCFLVPRNRAACSSGHCSELFAFLMLWYFSDPKHHVEQNKLKMAGQEASGTAGKISDMQCTIFI
jgi:hypothetical protein